MPNRDQELLQQLVPGRRAQKDKAKPRYQPLHLLAVGQEADVLEQQLRACSLSPNEHRASKGTVRGPSRSKALHILHQASQGGSYDSDIESPVSQRPLQEPAPPAGIDRGASRLGRLHPDPLQLRAQASSQEHRPGKSVVVPAFAAAMPGQLSMEVCSGSDAACDCSHAQTSCQKLHLRAAQIGQL